MRLLVLASSKLRKMVGFITSTPRGTTSSSRDTKARSISTPRKTILISGTMASGTPTIWSTSPSLSSMPYRDSSFAPHTVMGTAGGGVAVASADCTSLPKKSLSLDTCLGPMHRVSRSDPGV